MEPKDFEALVNQAVTDQRWEDLKQILRMAKVELTDEKTVRAVALAYQFGKGAVMLRPKSTEEFPAFRVPVAMVSNDPQGVFTISNLKDAATRMPEHFEYDETTGQLYLVGRVRADR